MNSLCPCHRWSIQSVMTDSSGFDQPSFETATSTIDAWVPPAEAYWDNRTNRKRRRSLVLAVVLFFLTLLSTLVVGAQFAAAYSAGQSPDFQELFSSYGRLAAHPRLLLTGLPFAFTLLAILLAHELGHYFACRYYGIASTYPYFIPAPTLIGT